MLYEITDGRNKTWIEEIPMHLLRLSRWKKIGIFFRFIIGLKGYVAVQTTKGLRWFRPIRRKKK